MLADHQKRKKVLKCTNVDTVIPVLNSSAGASSKSNLKQCEDDHSEIPSNIVKASSDACNQVFTGSVLVTNPLDKLLRLLPAGQLHLNKMLLKKTFHLFLLRYQQQVI